MSLSEKLAGFSPLFFESTEFRALIAATQAEIKPSSDSILFIDYIGLFTDEALGTARAILANIRVRKGSKTSRPSIGHSHHRGCATQPPAREPQG